MISQILRTVLGVIIFICSTPAGMAQEAIREDVRADFFVAREVGTQDQRQSLPALDDAALPASFTAAEQTGGTVDGGRETKREQKRTHHHKTSFGTQRAATPKATTTEATLTAQTPQPQAAQQERKAVIRFLQLEALDC